MRALCVQGYGPDEGIRLEELATPEPRAGEVRVRVQACGVSFVDLLLASGGYQVRQTPPFIPGSEFSGTVDALGPGTETGLQPGDRVCGTRQGAWAEFICLPAASALPLPAGASLVEASVLIAPYGTALYALRDRASLRAGETLLVLGATGSVGHAVIQLGKVLGARVLAVASTPSKRAAARAAGADEVLDSHADWKAEAKLLSAPGGVDVVLDTVGGEATDAAFRTLGWGGRHLMVGFAGGQIGLLKSNLAIVKGAALLGVDFRQAGERQPALVAQIKRDVLDLYHEGRIRPLVSQVLALAQISEAAAQVHDRERFGRVVLTLAAAP